MGKAEAVAKYRAEYLRGKSEEKKAKFEKKDIERQYSSIMSWRHNQRVKQRRAETGESVLSQLHAIVKGFNDMELLTVDHLSAIEIEIDAFKAIIQKRRANFKNEQMQKLLNEKEALEQKIKALQSGE